MNSAQIVKHLGLTFKAATEGSDVVRSGDTVMAVMAAPVPFYLYNPSILSSPEGVMDYLMEAAVGDDGQYQLSMSHYTGPLATDDYSKLVILTPEEALLFKELYDKSVQLHARLRVLGLAYDDLLDEFEDLKASFTSRAALYEPEGIEELELQYA